MDRSFLFNTVRHISRNVDFLRDEFYRISPNLLGKHIRPTLLARMKTFNKLKSS